MILKIKKSLTNINYKLLIALLIMGLCPTIYNTVRIFWLGELPGEYSYSIAGQLSWINLIYEVLNEAIILPLFYFIGKALYNKEELVNKIKTGLIISFLVYLVLSSLVIIFTEPLLRIMATSDDIITQSIEYIRLEAIANVFSILVSFLLVVLVTLGKNRYVYALTFIKLLLRLYDPTNGNIYYNDLEYKDIVPKCLRNKFVTVFQNYQIYALTVAENILLRKVENEEDEILVINAIFIKFFCTYCMNTFV